MFIPSYNRTQALAVAHKYGLRDSLDLALRLGRSCSASSSTATLLFCAYIGDRQLPAFEGFCCSIESTKGPHWWVRFNIPRWDS